MTPETGAADVAEAGPRGVESGLLTGLSFGGTAVEMLRSGNYRTVTTTQTHVSFVFRKPTEQLAWKVLVPVQNVDTIYWRRGSRRMVLVVRDVSRPLFQTQIETHGRDGRTTKKSFSSVPSKDPTPRCVASAYRSIDVEAHSAGGLDLIADYFRARVDGPRILSSSPPASVEALRCDAARELSLHIETTLPPRFLHARRGSCLSVLVHL